MTASTTLQLGMSLDDYLQRYSDEGRFEIINGEPVFMSPHPLGHGLIVRWLFVNLFQFLVDNPEWEVFQELAFAQVTPGMPNWVKGALEPDLMILSKVKFAQMKAAVPDWKKWPITFVPELVIEVVSPNDRYSTVFDKITEYMALGVSVVWLIDPRHLTVSIYRSGNPQPEVLSGTQTLTAPTILPGLGIPLAELFDAK